MAVVRGSMICATDLPQCTLIHWYRAGLDVERELPKLATLSRPCAHQRNVLVSGSSAELLQLATDRVTGGERRHARDLSRISFPFAILLYRQAFRQRASQSPHHRVLP